MLFTLKQFVFIAFLAFAHLASAISAAHYKRLWLSSLSTLLGSSWCLVAAFLAAKNLLLLLTATEPVNVFYGKSGTLKAILDASGHPLIYFIALLLQLCTIVLFLFLAYKNYSDRARD